MGTFKRFKTDQSGATAVIFGLSFLPMIGLVGAAIDYSRASDIHARYQRGVDAAALALVSVPKGASAKELMDKAQAVFDRAFGSASYVVTLPVSARREGARITVEASGSVTNAFMQILGHKTTEVGATASVNSARPNIELALVLDNTGSMRDEIEGKTKMYWLQKQAKALLGDLQSMATDPNSVRVSLVPFDTEVRLDTKQYGDKDWFRWDAFSGSRRDWDGYLIDRFGSFATSDDAPIGRPAGYPAVKSRYPQPLAPMRPLTALYSPDGTNAAYKSLVGVVEGMQPRGNTNIALGVMWGLATLSKSEPFTDTESTNVQKYLVALTDGDNTMNHVDGAENFDVGKINRATEAACDLAKSTKISSPAIEVFTIRLLKGDEDLLRNCASRPANYFDVRTPADLKKAFEAIRNKIVQTKFTS